MAYDFSCSDLKSHFTPDAAAIAWCEAEKTEDLHTLRFKQIRSAILQAVKDGDLDAEIPYKVVERRFRSSLYDVEERDYDRATILRTDLAAWAAARGVKPRFLFPEQRVATDSAPVAEKEISPRQNQLDKVRCQAIAQALWDTHPQRTIADMTKDKQIQKFGNGGQYTQETLEAWLREVDPRAPDKKTGRPKKTPEFT